MGAVERPLGRPHEKLAAVRAVKQRFHADVVVFERAAHPAGNHTERNRTVIAQQHGPLSDERVRERLLIGFFERAARKRLCPDGAHRRKRGVHVGHVVLDAHELSLRAERQLRRGGGGNAGRTDLVADRPSEQAVMRTPQQGVRVERGRRNAGEPVRRTQHGHQHDKHDERDIFGGIPRRTLRASHALSSFPLGARSVGSVMCTVVPFPYSLSSSI